jgi:hypothetical protein
LNTDGDQSQTRRLSKSGKKLSSRQLTDRTMSGVSDADDSVTGEEVRPLRKGKKGSSSQSLLDAKVGGGGGGGEEKKKKKRSSKSNLFDEDDDDDDDDDDGDKSVNSKKNVKKLIPVKAIDVKNVEKNDDDDDDDEDDDDDDDDDDDSGDGLNRQQRIDREVLEDLYASTMGDTCWENIDGWDEVLVLMCECDRLPISHYYE